MHDQCSDVLSKTEGKRETENSPEEKNHMCRSPANSKREKEMAGKLDNLAVAGGVLSAATVGEEGDVGGRRCRG